SPRAHLHAPQLLTLFSWDEATFLKQTEGSAIRRIGHRRWLRNIAVALGNAPYQAAILQALQQRLGDDELVNEHIQWAIEEQLRKQSALAAFCADAPLIPIQQDSTTQQRRLVRAIEKGLPRDA
ncbi:MAG: tRNA epoxyqueuosine(34) reductase QueG, partial [Plesiomonas sp.]